ncbi:hypothetical protein [Stackebrandtia nassauensis]|uniref:Uncharacterized protein n=1 Tax=Stackebrandtia nassauensis (strain DSM 44728 / CIP 108903 / NRRL B-16338 / NBRC 102104 / LLR-40K-21) TaxID=446470 RepID=D3PWQ1_STANL|nr:hypothetical protein [Stackebrandtia nassauensis]ADD43273.1 hypothetical protein Snas_3613 [Stackebrandtia nassauensis DSM 44728]
MHAHLPPATLVVVTSPHSAPTTTAHGLYLATHHHPEVGAYHMVCLRYQYAPPYGSRIQAYPRDEVAPTPHHLSSLDIYDMLELKTTLHHWGYPEALPTITAINNTLNHIAPLPT